MSSYVKKHGDTHLGLGRPSNQGTQDTMYERSFHLNKSHHDNNLVINDQSELGKISNIESISNLGIDLGRPKK